MTDQEIHKQFSVKCFNDVWDSLESDERTREDNNLMLSMSHASLFHWMKRDDRTATNLSIGLWQISRVHSVLGNAEAAMRYANECIQLSEAHSLDPFFRACGYEAAARAAKVAGDVDPMNENLDKAKTLAAEVTDEQQSALLAKDIASLE